MRKVWILHQFGQTGRNLIKPVVEPEVRAAPAAPATMAGTGDADVSDSHQGAMDVLKIRAAHPPSIAAFEYDSGTARKVAVLGR